MKFILASKSERRITYLKAFGFDFEIAKVDLEEKIFENSPLKTVVYNAYAKANKVKRLSSINEVILGMDTVVSMDMKIFGKPKNKKENIEMLKKFTNREHLVITGVVGLKNDVSFVDYDVTRVRFKNVEEGVLKRYVETGEGLDKAGGYAIQGLGAMLIDKVDGSVDNVIGIPLLKVMKILRTIGEV